MLLLEKGRDWRHRKRVETARLRLTNVKFPEQRRLFSPGRNRWSMFFDRAPAVPLPVPARSILHERNCGGN